MEKVFSWKAYITEVIKRYDSFAEFKNDVLSAPRGWVAELEGLTKKEINEIGYSVLGDWMVEKED